MPRLDDDDILLPPHLLVEGKAIGTAARRHLRLHAELNEPHAYHKEAYQQHRHRGRTAGRRKFNEVREHLAGGLFNILSQFEGGGDEAGMRDKAKELLDQSWQDSFAAGLRAGGAARGELNDDDQRWFRSAVRHETTYLNRMLDSVAGGKYKMPLARRCRLYAGALKGVYESARVIALPDDIIVHWLDHDDDRECNGCQYMAENSPYTKYQLPTTPGASSCRCLGNCRCRLYIRRATMDEVRKVNEDQVFTRAQHVRNLRRLKRGEDV